MEDMAESIVLLCICGHDVNRHVDAGGTSLPMCGDCFLVGDPMKDYGHKFKMDNLRYLEWKSGLSHKNT
jgi:hypothetical protein